MVNVETAAIVWGDRYFPVSTVADSCRALEASGVVDGVMIADQLANFVPRQLWTPENAPLAGMIPDPDSHSDAFVLGTYAHLAAPGLKLHLTTDSVRRAPAELVQALLTLANITEGRINLQVGGGEIKQTKPFGHPTNQGMSRMKDLFEIYHKFMDSNEPFDHDGRRWKLRNAYLGGARTFRPEIWGLGAGPMLLDYCTSYADGVASAAPMAWTSPEMAAEKIAALRADVERKGRDPEAFRIGLWACSLVHEDPDYLDRALENAIIKFVCGVFGRIETRLWKEEGLGLPFPDGWTYFKDLLPYDTDDGFITEIVNAVTRQHLEKGWFIGSPQEVAAQIQPYLDAGVDWVLPLDFLPIIGDPADAEAAFGRTIAMCANLKGAVTSDSTPRSTTSTIGGRGA